MNWTPATATLSDAFAVTEVVAETVAPAVGAVIETVGGVVSAVTTALAWFDGDDRLPAASSAAMLAFAERLPAASAASTASV